MSESYDVSKDILLKIIDPDIKPPTRGTTSSAGLDFYSPIDVEIGHGKIVKIPLGVAIKVPDGHVGRLLDRSSLASPPYGLHVLGGVIDSDYTGELAVIFKNLGHAPIEIDKHQKIVQLVVYPVVYPEVVEVGEMPVTERKGGFGSTGK